MCKKSIINVNSMTGGRFLLDPSSVDDPLLSEIDWTPAKKSGTKFRTHELVSVNANRLEFRSIKKLMLLYIVLVLVGLGMLIWIIFSKLSSGGVFTDMETIWQLFLGFSFAGVGGSSLYSGTVPMVFDKKRGFFWKGKKAPDEIFEKSSFKHFVKLENIHVIQLISKFSRRSNNPDSFEVNIVLHDGKRINILNHSNQVKLRDDAETLANFLGITVWDGI